jgi:hypothetical protein
MQAAGPVPLMERQSKPTVVVEPAQEAVAGPLPLTAKQLKPTVLAKWGQGELAGPVPLAATLQPKMLLLER